MKPLEIYYDTDNDIVTIEGIKYTGDFFRALSKDGIRIGNWLKIIAREDHTVTIQSYDEKNDGP